MNITHLKLLIGTYSLLILISITGCTKSNNPATAGTANTPKTTAPFAPNAPTATVPQNHSNTPSSTTNNEATNGTTKTTTNASTNPSTQTNTSTKSMILGLASCLAYCKNGTICNCGVKFVELIF